LETIEPILTKPKSIVDNTWRSSYCQSNVNHTSGPCDTWPWPAAVRHQCCCSSNDWNAQIWPRYDVTERLTLVACTWTNYIQVVRSRLQLSARFSATLPTRSHSACRWSHFTTSIAVIIFICPAAAGNAT